MKKMLALFAVAAALCMSANSSLAQNNGGGGGGGRRGGGGGGGFGGGGGGGGNFDPAQFQQRMMDNVKDRLGFTNDTDWTAVQPLVQKVMDARRETQNFGGFGRGGGRRGGGNGGGGGAFGGQTDPDREALQQALDNNAPSGQVKAALDKFRASQKAKQSKLVSAQADLQKVLSPKQEAEAVLMGLLN
jgi:Spy/CpxP family protein refolding chaperone